MMKIKCIVLIVTVAMVSSQAFAATDLANGGFELPDTATRLELNGVNDSWDYAPNSFRCGVIPQNEASFCPGLAAAEGDQFGYLWCNGDEIAQSFGGFEIGKTYPVVWSEAARAATPDGNLWVLMDSVTLMAAHDVPNDETWRQQSVNFTATATSHRLRFFHGGVWDTMTFVDNVQILPEPATFGLLALVGLAFLRRK